MSEPENFLTRWSRRKRMAEEPDQLAPAADAAPDKAPEASAPASAKPPAARPSDPPKPAFDSATLPSLDSIGAQTDIRAFLQAGVPSAMRLAALRRAWTADQAILNFKGLAENDWDFTATDSMRGFGELDPGTDVKKMVAQMFDQTSRAEESAVAAPTPAQEAAPPAGESNTPAVCATRDVDVSNQPQIGTAANTEMVQREENTATQNDDAEIGGVQTKRRRSQGSAMPQ
jgi:hypothetical protein